MKAKRYRIDCRGITCKKCILNVMVCGAFNEGTKKQIIKIFNKAKRRSVPKIKEAKV